MEFLTSEEVILILNYNNFYLPYTKMIKVTENYLGRWCAVLLVVPLLLYACYILKKTSEYNNLISNYLSIFSIVFLLYEILWLCGILYH